MKLKNLLGILLLSMFSVHSTECSDDNENKEEIYELTFERENYETRLNCSQSITVRSGNKNYSITIANPELLDASMDLTSHIGFGTLRIIGKQKGETILTVTDNINGDKVDLNIEITDCYIGFRLNNNTIHPLFKDSDCMFLVNNKIRTSYFYDKDMKVQHKGTYEFLVKENNPYLIFKFEQEIEGQKEYCFHIFESSNGLFSIIERYLSVDLNTLKDALLINQTSSPFMCIQEVNTDKEVNLILDMMRQIPNGVIVDM